MAAISSPSSWNFFNSNVQSGLLEGRYINSAFTLVAAGPPRLAATGTTGGTSAEVGDIAWPIGLIKSMNLGQTSQIMRLWEVGSERSYFARGRTMGNLGLGRMVYHGPNILRALYAYLDAIPAGDDGNVEFDALYPNTAKAVLNTSGKGDSKKGYHVNPGSPNMWLELASDVFSQPVGLLLLFKDSNVDVVGAFYVEYVMVANHGLALDAGGALVTENTALLYERIVPVDVSTVELIKDASSVASIVGSTVVGSAG